MLPFFVITKPSRLTIGEIVAVLGAMAFIGAIIVWA